MVWGLKEPIGFGDYRPEGKCQGWEAQLKQYWDNLSLDEQEQWGTYSARPELSLVDYFHKNYGSVPCELLPDKFQADRGYKSLSSLITVHSLLAVDEELKSIIEKLEPGVHQFWPIKILMPRGKVYPKQYYGMIIGNFRDSFVPEESEYVRYTKEVDSYWGCFGTKADHAKLTFSLEKIGGAHLFREKRVSSPRILISDELQSAIAEAELRIFKHHKVKVI